MDSILNKKKKYIYIYIYKLYIYNLCLHTILLKILSYHLLKKLPYFESTQLETNKIYNVLIYHV